MNKLCTMVYFVGETEKPVRTYITSKDCIASPLTMAKMHSNLKGSDQTLQTAESSVMEMSGYSESDM